MEPEPTWEKAVAMGHWSPAMLEKFPGLHLTMLGDKLDQLATEKFGEGCWVMHEDGRTAETFEPPTRDHEETDEDEESDTFGQVIRWRDEDTYFQMSARFRAKKKAENGS